MACQAEPAPSEMKLRGKLQTWPGLEPKTWGWQLLIKAEWVMLIKLIHLDTNSKHTLDPCIVRVFPGLLQLPTNNLSSVPGNVASLQITANCAHHADELAELMSAQMYALNANITWSWKKCNGMDQDRQLAVPTDQLARLAMVLWNARFHIQQPELVWQLWTSASTAVWQN